MPRLLVYTTPARGHLYPILPMLVELRSGRLRPDRLRAAVRAAIACKAGAERIAVAFAAIKPHLAADAIEALLRG